MREAERPNRRARAARRRRHTPPPELARAYTHNSGDGARDSESGNSELATPRRDPAPACLRDSDPQAARVRRGGDATGTHTQFVIVEHSDVEPQ